MAELKTKKNKADVGAFLDAIENEKRRQDCRAVVDLMADATGEAPAMWGDSIIGFGSYHYQYATGREGDWMATGVSPRKQNLTVYIMTGFDRHDALMKRLGRYRTGRSCLYINKLEDVDLAVLRELVRESFAKVSKGQYGW
ncbi:MAG: DUF1801 domain-containing protein [Acidobacteria bacterium]|nr:DUF1801 domain-containing protein [Acidobacteriota bacterium]MYD70374.1 DUF1801 domain-containing protein [Acidobacteriota bacterium]MYJ04239.1 DUF1801 domain-containing protein [Acidobacteriota bacterium]